MFNTIVVAVIIAFLCSLVLIFGEGRQRGTRPFLPLVVFFVIVFLAILATWYWVTPFGPVYWGISWAPLIVIAIVFYILLSTQSPYRRRKSEEEAVTRSISVFVWLLLILLLAAVIAGFLYRGPAETFVSLSTGDT